MCSTISYANNPRIVWCISDYKYNPYNGQLDITPDEIWNTNILHLQGLKCEYDIHDNSSDKPEETINILTFGQV